MKDYTHKFKKTDDTKRVLSDILTTVFKDNSEMLPYSCNITSDDAEENFTVNMSFQPAKPQQSMSNSVKNKFKELEDKIFDAEAFKAKFIGDKDTKGFVFCKYCDEPTPVPFK